MIRHGFLPVEISAEIPAEWSYETSVDRVRTLTMRWRDVTVELLQELWVAREMLRNQGARTDLTSSQMLRSWAQYCEDTGLERMTVHRWLKRYDPVTRAIRDRMRGGGGPLPLGTKYRVVYADPPWAYGQQQHGAAGTVQMTTLAHHYPSMTTKELCALPVADLAKDNAVLFLWVTSPLLIECSAVIDAWGFAYKASTVWDKVKHNVGHYVSVRHEFLLICTQRSCLPDVRKLPDSVYVEERTRHSAKPLHFRDLIDTLYPSGKRIELFCRGSTAKGWDAWGQEAPQ